MPHQRFREALRPLVDPFLHARTDHAVTVLDGLEDSYGGHHRLAVSLLQPCRLKGHVPWHAFELESLDDPLRRRYLVVDPIESILVAVRILLDESPKGARSHFHLSNNSREIPRPPPLLYQVR